MEKGTLLDRPPIFIPTVKDNVKCLTNIRIKNPDDVIAEAEYVFGYVEQKHKIGELKIDTRMMTNYLRIFCNFASCDKAYIIFNEYFKKYNLIHTSHSYKAILENCAKFKQLRVAEEIYATFNRWIYSLQEYSDFLPSHVKFNLKEMGAYPHMIYMTHYEMINLYAKYHYKLKFCLDVIS